MAVTFIASCEPQMLVYPGHHKIYLLGCMVTSGPVALQHPLRHTWPKWIFFLLQRTTEGELLVPSKVLPARMDLTLTFSLRFAPFGSTEISLTSQGFVPCLGLSLEPSDSPSERCSSLCLQASPLFLRLKHSGNIVSKLAVGTQGELCALSWHFILTILLDCASFLLLYLTV